MSPFFRPDRFVTERLQHAATVAFVEDPASLPRWLRALIPTSKQQFLDGLKRIAATPFARPVVEAVQGRTLQIGGRSRVDFATGCYLGLDFDLTDGDVAATRAVGLRNGWSRASGTTPVTRALEDALAERIGFECVRLGASISLINYSVFYSLKHLFPLVLVDADAHMTMKRGIYAAYGRGRRVRTFRNNDLADLGAQLAALPADLPKLVCVDGVYSMKGTRAPLRGLLDLCARHGATLYVDDAHGFGTLGASGLGVAEQLRPEDRERVILAAGFAKSCSNPVAFVAFPQRVWYGVDAADFLTFCGPPSNLHTVVALRHLRGFDTPDYAQRRERVRAVSERLHGAAAQLGAAVFSEAGLPMLSVRIRPERMEWIVDRLDAGGILAKIAIFPVARHGDESIRFSLTALHTDAQLQALITALGAVAPGCVPAPRTALIGAKAA